MGCHFSPGVNTRTCAGTGSNVWVCEGVLALEDVLGSLEGMKRTARVPTREIVHDGPPCPTCGRQGECEQCCCVAARHTYAGANPLCVVCAHPVPLLARFAAKAVAPQ